MCVNLAAPRAKYLRTSSSISNSRMKFARKAFDSFGKREVAIAGKGDNAMRKGKKKKVGPRDCERPSAQVKINRRVFLFPFLL